MLQIADIEGCIAILANVHSRANVQPVIRTVNRSDLVTLQMTRADSSECIVGGKDFDVPVDPQFVDRTHRHAQQSRMRIDLDTITIGRKHRSDGANTVYQWLTGTGPPVGQSGIENRH